VYGTVTSAACDGHTPTSGGFTLIVHDGDCACAPVESRTVMRYVVAPVVADTDTVPLITPVALLMVNPAGSAPDDTVYVVYTVDPPLAVPDLGVIVWPAFTVNVAGHVMLGGLGWYTWLPLQIND